MFLGSFAVRVREKNRIVFPAKFREQTGDNLVITNWFERSILLLSKKDWERLIKDLFIKNSFLLPDVRDLERFIFEGTYEIQLDSEGRFVLPKALMLHSLIQKEAIFIGGLWYISLWDKAQYENYRDINNLLVKEKAVKIFNKLKENKNE